MIKPPDTDPEYLRQIAAGHFSRNTITPSSTAWDFKEFHKTADHVTHVRENKEVIKNKIILALNDVTMSGGAIITLLIGIGDPDPADVNMASMMDALSDMRRVIFTQDNYVKAEILPIKIYCFKSRDGFQFDIGYLTGKENEDIDTLEFAYEMRINRLTPTAGELNRLFSKLESLSRAPFTVFTVTGDDKTPFIWKQVICHLFKSAPTPRGVIQNQDIANVFKDASIDYSKELIDDLKNWKSITRRRAVIIELPDSRSDTGPAESDV